ncbi:hypothetical protein G9444_2445 [Rhodococcus erythropolis]|uniref:Uncharacterized protein n=2 Tax=Rhodococcus erythropolis TaxID=1833 RepID=A0A6G9CS28_RHOER|nr:hypothetical protein G9444_2445 [Rhodococcus erythropolis]
MLMTAPDPGLTDLIAAHRPNGVVPMSLKLECSDHIACSCGSWVSYKCGKGVDPYVEFDAHVASVRAALEGEQQ